MWSTVSKAEPWSTRIQMECNPVSAASHKSLVIRVITVLCRERKQYWHFSKIWWLSILFLPLIQEWIAGAFWGIPRPNKIYNPSSMLSHLKISLWLFGDLMPELPQDQLKVILTGSATTEVIAPLASMYLSAALGDPWPEPSQSTSRSATTGPDNLLTTTPNSCLHSKGFERAPLNSMHKKFLQRWESKTSQAGASARCSVYQVCPAASNTIWSNSSLGGDQLIALYLSSPECQTTTDLLIWLMSWSLSEFWYRVNLWSTLRSNLVFMTSMTSTEVQKHRAFLSVRGYTLILQLSKGLMSIPTPASHPRHIWKKEKSSPSSGVWVQLYLVGTAERWRRGSACLCTLSSLQRTQHQCLSLHLVDPQDDEWKHFFFPKFPIKMSA